MATQHIIDTAQEIIDRIDRIAGDTGCLPSTICQQAFKNPKVYDRLKRRIGYDESLSARLDDLERSISEKTTEAGQ